MYDRKVIRRRRATLGVLVALSVFLITVSFGDSAGGGVRAIQRGAQEVLSPLETGASKALKPFRDAVGWTGDVLQAQGENERLRDELAALRREVARVTTARRDAEQLRAFGQIVREDAFPGDSRPVTARVIARSPTLWYANVQINRGSGDGIREDQPVITGDGLAGKVTAVTGGSATVTLITDPERSAVSAQVMPDGANGIVRAKAGNPRDLLLDFVEKGRKIRQGATLVTSGFTSSRGLESKFPRGIPIGKVKKVNRTELELYQRVHIEPFAELRRMDYVQVLTGGGGGERAAAGAPDQVALP